MLSPRLRWKLNRYRERIQEAFGSLFRSPPKPRVCFSCGRLVGAAEKVCSHCGASQAAFSVSVFKRLALAVIPAENPVTYLLLFANLLFFAVAYVNSVQAGAMSGLFGGIDSEVLTRLGAKRADRILLNFELWRLVMPIFLHASILHFGFNSFVLWQVGPQVEELFGSRRFLFLYLATGVAGFVVSVWWYPFVRGFDVQTVGSSGSIFGLIGILLSYISQQAGFASEYRASLIRWVIFILVIGIFFPFDNAAHIGGLLTGMALGRLVSVRRPATAAARLRLALMSWGSVLVIAWSLAMVLLHLP
ncbi:MAG: rhomboid family intramembrane serine protease, partial [Terriglobia bacterium]